MGRLREGLGSLQAEEALVGRGSSAPEIGEGCWKVARTNPRGLRCEGRGATPGKLGQDGVAGEGKGHPGRGRWEMEVRNPFFGESNARGAAEGAGIGSEVVPNPCMGWLVSHTCPGACHRCHAEL